MEMVLPLMASPLLWKLMEWYLGMELTVQNWSGIDGDFALMPAKRPEQLFLRIRNEHTL
jgi:hypothetical protein